MRAGQCEGEYCVCMQGYDDGSELVPDDCVALRQLVELRLRAMELLAAAELRIGCRRSLQAVRPAAP